MLTSEEPAEAAYASIPFSCVVAGEKLLKPTMSANAICSKFAEGLSKGLAAKLLPTQSVAGKTWITLNVRFSKPGVATANLIYSKNGNVGRYPDISVATSDRAMDVKTVEILVRAVTDHAKKAN